MSEREFSTLDIGRQGPIRRVTLSRPEVLNALDGRTLTELRKAMADADADPEVRAVRLDAAGDRAFCSGIDVAYVKDLSGAQAREVGRELHRTFGAIRTMDKPVVAAIDGLCLGAGLELAVSCDLMIASDRSQFGLPNVHRGIPAIVEAAILPMVVGLQGARELAYTGRNWDAAKAERRGLLNACVPAGDLAAEADRWCAELADKSAIALSTQKEIIHQWMCTDLESAIEFSINTVMLAFSSREQKQSMQAFVDRRGGGRG